jgi:hypothetical protein
MDPVQEEIPRNINTFAENSQTIIGLNMGKMINSLWGFSYFSIEMRTFLFKMHNNTLGLNNRVAHFVRDRDPICTFCQINRRGDAADENTIHLFYECPTVENIRDPFFVWAYREGRDYSISRSELFLVQTIGNSQEINGGTVTRTIIAKFFLKYIWDSRCRYSLPNLEEIKEITRAEIRTIYNTSVKMRTYINDSGLANLFLQG